MSSGRGERGAHDAMRCDEMMRGHFEGLEAGHRLGNAHAVVTVKAESRDLHGKQ